jgi:hypothetical protein
MHTLGNALFVVFLILAALVSAALAVNLFAVGAFFVGAVSTVNAAGMAALSVAVILGAD